MVQITQQIILITGSAPQQNQQQTSSQQPEIWELQYAQDCHLIIHEHPDMETLIQAMEKGVALAVSNGSFSQDMGAVAWMLEGAIEIGQCMASCLALGQPGDHRAF